MYVTDGVAVRDALLNNIFNDIDVFIVDEAHERSI